MTCRQQKSLGLKLNYPVDNYCELRKNKSQSVEFWETWLGIHASGAFSISNHTLFNITWDVFRHILQFSKNLISFYIKDISRNAPLTLYLSSKDMCISRVINTSSTAWKLSLFEFFCSVFPRIRTEYGEILHISLYSVGMWKNAGQKKLRIRTLFMQCCLMKFRLARHGLKIISKGYHMYE